MDEERKDQEKKEHSGQQSQPPSSQSTWYPKPALVVADRKDRHKKKTITTTILAICIPLSLTLGAVGGVFADRFLWPYLQQYSFITNNKLFRTIDTSSGRTTVIRKEETVTVSEESGIIDSVSKVSPSVVSIVTSANVQDFFGNVSERKGGGTGFIITEDGLILTNKHVAQGTDAKLSVITSTGESYEAKVLSLDPSNDIAVLKIEAKNLPVVKFGDSDGLKVGQRVVAIGNALGQYQNTVTAGVLSAKDRTITANDNGNVERLEGILQTDAAINPGNSGGPLTNLSGEVIGMNTAIDANGQTIGFAIPINIVKPAITSVIETGQIVRPFLGVHYLPITNEIAELNKLSVKRGALIQAGSTTDVAVLPGSPADKAGLQANDIIIKINNDELTENKGLAYILQKYKPGDAVEITYLRAGKEQKTKATLDKTK